METLSNKNRLALAHLFLLAAAYRDGQPDIIHGYELDEFMDSLGLEVDDDDHADLSHLWNAGADWPIVLASMNIDE